MSRRVRTWPGWTISIERLSFLRPSRPSLRSLVGRLVAQPDAHQGREELGPLMGSIPEGLPLSNTVEPTPGT